MYARNRVRWSTDARHRTELHKQLRPTSVGVLRRLRSPTEWTRSVTKHPSIRHNVHPDDRRHSGLDLGSRRYTKRDFRENSDPKGKTSRLLQDIDSLNIVNASLINWKKEFYELIEECCKAFPAWSGSHLIEIICINCGCFLIVKSLDTFDDTQITFHNC